MPNTDASTDVAALPLVPKNPLPHRREDPVRVAPLVQASLAAIDPAAVSAGQTPRFAIDSRISYLSFDCPLDEQTGGGAAGALRQAPDSKGLENE